jgi:hypothetical protein
MEENPYKSPDFVEQVQPVMKPAKHSRKPITLIEFVVVVAIIIVLTG